MKTQPSYSSSPPRSLAARCLAVLVAVAVAATTNNNNNHHHGLFFAEAFSFADGPRSRAKANLLETVASGAPDEDVLKAVGAVERYSFLAGGADLSNPLLPGNWLMVWTTSESIAGKNRPGIFRTATPPEQLLDIENGRAINAETLLLGLLRNAVTADLSPLTRNKVGVGFREFSVGPIRFRPEAGKFRGELSVTYLDEDMRISRGDRGNAFVLLRESTQRTEANRVWREWRKSW